MIDKRVANKINQITAAMLRKDYDTIYKELIQVYTENIKLKEKQSQQEKGGQNAK